MGIAVQQYRAAIGLWYNRVKYPVNGVKNPSCLMESVTVAAVIGILLIIGGIEINTGPLSWDDIDKIKDVVKEVCKDNVTKDFILSQNKELKDSLKAEMASLRGDLEKNCGEIEELKEYVLDLEHRLKETERRLYQRGLEDMRRCIIIYGIPETKGENKMTLLSTTLETSSKGVQVECRDQDVEDVWRIGRKPGNRPIKLRLVSGLKTDKILGNAKSLKGTRVWIRKEMSGEELKDRKLLQFHLACAKHQCLNACIRGSRLVVNGDNWSRVYSPWQLKTTTEQAAERSSDICKVSGSESVVKSVSSLQDVEKQAALGVSAHSAVPVVSNNTVQLNASSQAAVLCSQPEYL